MRKENIVRTVLAGLSGTAVMTLLMLMAPLMGLPEMNIGEMLSEFMGLPLLVGWIAHFMVGTILSFFCVTMFLGRMPGPPWVKGALYAIIPWIVMNSAVIPMMGNGFFAMETSEPLKMIIGTLLGHLVYGAVLGAFYGLPQNRAASVWTD